MQVHSSVQARKAKARKEGFSGVLRIKIQIKPE
jgi:hypothetical protein